MDKNVKKCWCVYIPELEVKEVYACEDTKIINNSSEFYLIYYKDVNDKLCFNSV